jgi:hypothetical protein
MVRQELTSDRATGRLGKPHPEQDRIGGREGGPVCPRVGRLTLSVTEGLDRWSPLGRNQEEGCGRKLISSKYRTRLTGLLGYREADSLA